jgi:AcrR family transcriptional regulator
MDKPANHRRPRGRPLGFDPDSVLDEATALFWRNGLAGVSLDMISEATGVARPSLARAFGDKQDLYLKCMERYRINLRRTLGATLRSEGPIEDALIAFCLAAIRLYMTGGANPLGCLIINTAPSAAAEAPDVKDVLSEALVELDGAVLSRLRAAVKRGELGTEADIASIAYLTASLVHSLAVRARAGEPLNSLRRNARAAIRQLLR